MASPSPESSDSVTSPPPQPSAPPPPISPSSQPNADPPEPVTPSTPSPPPPLPPDVVPTAPSPTTPSSLPPQSPVATSPPPPEFSSPLVPQPTQSPPPPSPQAIAPSLPPPPPPPSPSTSNPQPPPSDPPVNSSPPPPPSEPPESVFSPPPKPTKSVSSPPPPPPPSPDPSKSVPTPSNPSENPPKSVPPVPHRNSPPPPASTPPKNPPSTPPSPSPENAPLLPIPSSSQASPPPPNSTISSSPSAIIQMAPPPPSSASPPVPIQIPSPRSETVNNSTPSAPQASSNSAGNGVVGMVVIGALGGILVLSLIGLIVWCMKNRRKKTSLLNGAYVMTAPLCSSFPEKDSSFIKIHSSTPLVGSRFGSSNSVYSPTERVGLVNSRSWFTYEELVNATNGFSTENLLGEGGFGFVYKGYLPDGMEIAVKKLKIGGGQGEREFKAEVEIISRIHHRHLVSLVGYCISDNKRLLVYEYVPNSTLYFHLQGQGRPVLDWATRVKVASGAARGIAYLHEDCHPHIIHRDIKSANILLDNNFDARVSDFGLAKLAINADTHISTRVMGTFGYMAPEYATSGKLTEKSDVFSFGVVLLELITGRKSVDASQPMGDESLVEWARPLLSNAIDNSNFEGLVDPKLEHNYVKSEMFRMIEAAAACIRHSASKRPRMSQVVRAFDSVATSDLTNGMRLGESQIFNSVEQSAEIRLFRMMAFGSQDYSTHLYSQSSWNS